MDQPLGFTESSEVHFESWNPGGPLTQKCHYPPSAILAFGGIGLILCAFTPDMWWLARLAGSLLHGRVELFMYLEANLRSALSAIRDLRQPLATTIVATHRYDG